MLLRDILLPNAAPRPRPAPVVQQARFLGSTFVLEGNDAADSGAPLNENPCPSGTPQRHYWQTGLVHSLR